MVITQTAAYMAALSMVTRQMAVHRGTQNTGAESAGKGHLVISHFM